MYECIRVSLGCTKKDHPGDWRLACSGQWNSNMLSFFWNMTYENAPQEEHHDSFKPSFKNENKQPSNKQCINKKISLAGSDQPGRVTITGDGETKHLLLNASRLQSDMFAVLSSSDVWPKVIHIKHLACVLSPSPAWALFSIILSPSWAAQADTLFSLTPSFHFPLSMSCFSFCCSLSSLTSAISLCLSWLLSLQSLVPLPVCISISGLACLEMIRFDPSCWMILTWFPTSERFLSRLTFLS